MGSEDDNPWARMELTADHILHNLPTPHTDYLTQYVDYPVREDEVSELVAFDASVIVDRTEGQIGARCDHEAYNTLTLNLAVEIIDGRAAVWRTRTGSMGRRPTLSCPAATPRMPSVLCSPLLRRRQRTRTSPSSPAACHTRSRRRSRTPSAPERLQSSGMLSRSHRAAVVPDFPDHLEAPTLFSQRPLDDHLAGT